MDITFKVDTNDESSIEDAIMALSLLLKKKVTIGPLPKVKIDGDVARSRALKGAEARWGKKTEVASSA